MADAHQRNQIIPLSSAPHLDRLVRQRQVIHIADLAVEIPDEPIVKLAGARTNLVVPMLKENELIGAIGIYRQEVRPFTDKQIDLLQTSPRRPSSPLRTRGCLTSCGNSLEQQTATAEVLRVICSSPANCEPVFKAMLENSDAVMRGALWHDVAA